MNWSMPLSFWASRVESTLVVRACATENAMRATLSVGTRIRISPHSMNALKDVSTPRKTLMESYGEDLMSACGFMHLVQRRLEAFICVLQSLHDHASLRGPQARGMPSTRCSSLR